MWPIGMLRSSTGFGLAGVGGLAATLVLGAGGAGFAGGDGDGEADVGFANGAGAGEAAGGFSTGGFSTGAGAGKAAGGFSTGTGAGEAAGGVTSALVGGFGRFGPLAISHTIGYRAVFTPMAIPISNSDASVAAVLGTVSVLVPSKVFASKPYTMANRWQGKNHAGTTSATRSMKDRDAWVNCA